MFKSLPFWLISFIFLISAFIIWFIATYLEHLADAISKRTKLGHAFTGILLLAVTTSLSELASIITAIVFLNNPTLAVHNLLGGVALQIVTLVIVDGTKRDQGAITYFSPSFVLLIEGVGVIILLQLVIAGISAKGIPLISDSISIWPILIFFTYLGVMYLTYRNEEHPRWSPKKESLPYEQNSDHKKEHQDEKKPRKMMKYPMKRIWFLFAGAAIAVLIASWSAAQSADVLAEKTGLGSAFLGATLLALATSLPELSTTIAASRDKQYSMAFSNIFGSNAFNISLLLLAELLYLKGTILKHAGESVLLVASIGAVMIGVYLWGLMERKDRTIWRIGWDSAACLLIYLGGMTVLYFMV